MTGRQYFFYKFILSLHGPFEACYHYSRPPLLCAVAKTAKELLDLMGQRGCTQRVGRARCIMLPND